MTVTVSLVSILSFPFDGGLGENGLGPPVVLALKVSSSFKVIRSRCRSDWSVLAEAFTYALTMA